MPLEEFYRRLFEVLGPQGWWPGESPFEIAVGAILTQNTNWRNVERAIANLKAAGALSPQEMAALPREDLAALIRPAGYFNVKADRLGNFLTYLGEGFQMDMEGLSRVPPRQLREELLGLKGIGPETADSILLYAVGHPVFVIDAYTRRIFTRHGYVGEGVSYEALQGFFSEGLPREREVYNEFHALIVHVGKEYCRPRRTRCEECPAGLFRLDEQGGAD